MERYVYLDSSEDAYNVTGPKIKQIGVGSEGKAFLVPGNKVLKVFNPGHREDEDFIKKVITTQDIQADSFLLPETIFVLNGEFYGYTSRYFGKNLAPFNAKDLMGPDEFITDFSEPSLREIDFDKIFKAREKLIEDLRLLSQERILVFDTLSNMLYDGTKFGAIDTIYWSREAGNTFDENIRRVDCSMLIDLSFYDQTFEPNLDETFEKNVARIRK